jgi:hypothetical protein
LHNKTMLPSRKDWFSHIKIHMRNKEPPFIVVD